MGIFNDISIHETKIPKSTVHITLKRRFRLINITENQLHQHLQKINWCPINIQTKGIHTFPKSGIEHITTSPNSNITNLFQEISTTLQPFTETRDPEKEIGSNQEHANAHISTNFLKIDISQAIKLYGNKQLKIHNFLLVKDLGEDTLEVITKF